MIYFSSDIHWGHKNIIEYSKRPFASLVEMHEDCILHFKKLTHSDTLIYLGDFWGHSVEEVTNFFNNLKCKEIIFVLGNHDTWAIKAQNQSNLFCRMCDLYEFSYNKQYFVCCHYGMLCWNHQNHGSMQIMGHSHGACDKLNMNCRRLDVGFDSTKKWLISIDEVINQLKDKPFVNSNTIPSI